MRLKRNTRRMGFESLEHRAAPAAIMSTANVFEFPVGPPSGVGEDDGGASIATAVQNKNGVTLSMKVDDEDLQAGAYTLWAVVFNDPSDCVDGCGLDDAQAGRGGFSLAYVDGKVVNGNGKVNMSGHLNVDPDGPLTNLDAEIHLILRYHGPKEPGEVSTQIHTGEFGDGECPECEDVAAAILQAP